MPPKAWSPRAVTCCSALTSASGSYIADAGFGGLTLTAPLRLEADVEQSTPHGPFRLIRAGEEYVQQARLQDNWQTLYRFGLHEQVLADYEVSNWYLSNHPASFFTTGLIAARPDTDRRYALRNNELSVHFLNGKTEHHVLENAAQLRKTLEGQFRIALPKSPEVDVALEKLTAPASRTASV